MNEVLHIAVPVIVVLFSLLKSFTNQDLRRKLARQAGVSTEAGRGDGLFTRLLGLSSAFKTPTLARRRRAPNLYVVSKTFLWQSKKTMCPNQCVNV